MQQYVIQEQVSIFPQFDNINSILGYGPRIWKPNKQCPLSNVIDTGFTNFHIPLYYISRNYYLSKRTLLSRRRNREIGDQSL